MGYRIMPASSGKWRSTPRWSSALRSWPPSDSSWSGIVATVTGIVEAAHGPARD